MQQPVGEDVAALGVAAKLDLVHRQEIHRAVERHRFDGADVIGRVGRDDLLLAGDQRHGAGAFQGGDAVVILARQETQRKADHAGLMAEHALDGEVGLAGIGRAQDGPETRGAGDHSHALQHRVSRRERQGRRESGGGKPDGIGWPPGRSPYWPDRACPPGRIPHAPRLPPFPVPSRRRHAGPGAVSGRRGRVGGRRNRTQPYYAPLPPGYSYAPPPGYAVPRPPRVFACDGSEPLLGGLLGAAAGGVLGSALGQHHGRIDPGATLFGMFAGAMLGAAIASSGCP